MIDSFTASRSSIAFFISEWSPHATVAGLWIIIMLTGLIHTSVPAIAMTDAADAASPSIFTVTFPGYSDSMLKICAAATQSPPGLLIHRVMSPVPAFSSSLKRAGVTSSSNQLSSAITPFMNRILSSASCPLSKFTAFFFQFQNFFTSILPLSRSGKDTGIL